MDSIKNIRLKNYDYATNGFYFITISTDQKQRLFITDNKNVVEQFIERLNDINGVSVDYFVVMPDHVHMILVFDGCRVKLGEVMRRFKSRISQTFGKPVWQPNYYEHVIRNEKALDKIREYIQNNPDAEKMEWEQFYSEGPINWATTDK